MADSPNTTSLTSRRLFLAAGSAGAALGALGVAVAIDAGDAKLLRLAAAFRAAWAHEKVACATGGDDEYEAATDVTGAIVDEMIKTPARTLAGVRAKAEAPEG